MIVGNERICQRATESLDELDAIIAELDVEPNVLPVAALRQAQRRRPDIIPHLITLIEKATLAAQAGVSPTGNGHFFALFLLTEFQAKEALPAVLDVLRLPGEGSYDLYGDAVTECHALARLAVDSPDVIDDLISDRTLNEFTRWEAAQTYIHWVHDGHMTRDQAMLRLDFHLNNAIASHDPEGATALVVELLRISPNEVIETITEALERGLIDEEIVDRDCVMASLTDGESFHQASFTSLQDDNTTDCVEQLRSWSWFRKANESMNDSHRPSRSSVDKSMEQLLDRD